MNLVTSSGVFTYTSCDYSNETVHTEAILSLLRELNFEFEVISHINYNENEPPKLDTLVIIPDVDHYTIEDINKHIKEAIKDNIINSILNNDKICINIDSNMTNLNTIVQLLNKICTFKIVFEDELLCKINDMKVEQYKLKINQIYLSLFSLPIFIYSLLISIITSDSSIVYYL